MPSITQRARLPVVPLRPAEERRSTRELIAVLIVAAAVASALWRLASDDSLSMANNARAALSADYRPMRRPGFLEGRYNHAGTGVAAAQATPSQ